jgi:hypothetical protein
MAIVQSDLAGELAGGPRYAELIERRLGKDQNKTYTVMDVASVFDLSDTKVREWIEEGRLCAANLNAGMTCPVDPSRPDGERRALRPLWRMTREAIISHAKHMEAGV